MQATRMWEGMRINNQYCIYIGNNATNTIQLNWIFGFSLLHMCNDLLPLILSLRGQNTIAACLAYIVQWFICMHIYSNWNADFFQCILLIDNDIFAIINFLGYCCWCSIFCYCYRFARMLCTNKRRDTHTKLHLYGKYCNSTFFQQTNIVIHFLLKKIFCSFECQLKL